MTEVLTKLGLLALSILLLWKGAGWLIESAARIGRKFHLSDLTIGLTIVALGTSAPEFAVTVVAALKGHANISVGNIVGSNIFNIGFILGGCALFRAMKTTRPVIYRDGFLLIGTAFALAYILHDHEFSRTEGLCLFGGLFAYLLLLFATGKKADEEIPTGAATWKDYPLLLIGIGMVIGGGHFLVQSASELARMMGVSEWVIAVTIVAAGTSAPEFATALAAVAKGRHGISLGNLIGSDLFNLLGVLGVAGIIRPMKVDPVSIQSIHMLVGMCIIAVVFMRSGWRLSRWEGVVLILIGLGRWVLDFTRIRLW